ncbi:peptidoglycan-binding protein [Spirosoma taeanense]|uniref:Peptidoglycan-binding protein n=1 Tax=Spirosoma taeanense TaxID=2735870 RepID=A0A6M5Y4Z6_9BACT|nr:peptidoglycan-binding protein [Spirosoma taeanense]QJW88450.1 peptidoglycan-binding protein [Spirosoma taeanense]
MIKTAFRKEAQLATTLQQGSKGFDVQRVQEWLCLNAQRFPNVALNTTLDKDFGPATERAVRNFERAIKRPQTGRVTPDLFAALSEPLSTAFQTEPAASDVRKAVIRIAQMHLRQRSAELHVNEEQTNLGPWVRSYCDGLEGKPFKWCVGFVQTILDQAASGFGRAFTVIMPHTLSCDQLALSGQQSGRLIDNAKLRKDSRLARPGDVFLLRSSAGPVNDWFHAGLITSVSGDVLETIEGNTDSKGGSNGTAVFARVRNFQKATLDVFSIEGL